MPQTFAKGPRVATAASKPAKADFGLGAKVCWPAPAEVDGVSVLTIAGLGQPWVVKHQRAAMIFTTPDDDAVQEGRIEIVLGMAKHGRVLGIQRQLGRWLQVSQSANRRYVTGWVLQEHEDFGVLMEQLQGRPQLDSFDVAPAAVSIYRDVVELCHRRIWRENLETLWDGDAGQMPSKACIEEKLMRPGAAVLSASVGEEFVGGAIVHSLRVPSHGRAGNAAGVQGTTAVVYVDCCAALPDFGAGRALWHQITRMPGLLVVLHSINLEAALHFWKKCGMWQLDISRSEHQDWLTGELFVKSGGIVDMKLSELAAALPPSELPLFVLCHDGRSMPRSEVFLANF